MAKVVLGKAAESQAQSEMKCSAGTPEAPGALQVAGIRKPPMLSHKEAGSKLTTQIRIQSTEDLGIKPILLH